MLFTLFLLGLLYVVFLGVLFAVGAGACWLAAQSASTIRHPTQPPVMGILRFLGARAGYRRARSSVARAQPHPRLRPPE